jgi:hypothetical protein
MTSIDEQSQDIALGVNNSIEIKTDLHTDEDLNGSGRSGNDVRICLQGNI